MRPLASLADSVPSAASDAFEGVARGRMRFAQVSGILNAVAAEADIVGLAISGEIKKRKFMHANRRETTQRADISSSTIDE